MKMAGKCREEIDIKSEGVVEYEMHTIKGFIYRTKRHRQIPAEERLG